MQSAADALLAVKHGLDGVVISNHGGRNMDTARPSLEVLIEVTAALRQQGVDRSKFQVRQYPAILVLPCLRSVQHQCC